MLVADRSGAPRAGRHPAPPGARSSRSTGSRAGFALRNLVELGVLRRAGTRRAARRQDCPARRRDPPQPVRGGATGSTSARSCPASASCCRTRRRTVPPRERRLPTRAADMVRSLRDASDSAMRRTTNCRGAYPAPARHTWVNMRAVTRPLEGTLDLNDVAAGDGYLFVRDGSASPVAASLPACLRRGRRVLAAIEHDDGGGAGRSGRDRRAPFPAGRSRRAGHPERRRAQVRGRHRLGHPDRRHEQPRQADAARPVAASYDIRPGVDVAHYLVAVGSAREHRRGRIVKAVIARPITVTSDSPIDVHAVLGRLQPVRFGAIASRSTGSSGRPRTARVRRRRRDRSHPIAGTARSRAIPASTSGSRRAHRQHQEPGRAPHGDRDGARHVAAVELISTGSRNLDREGGERAAPRITRGGPPFEPSALGASSSGRCRRRPPSAASPDGALGLIAAVEGFERGRYGGAVGWVDAPETARGRSPSAAPSCPTATGPPRRRKRHRRRQRSARRARRDPGQVPSHALRHHPPLTDRLLPQIGARAVSSGQTGGSGSRAAATAALRRLWTTTLSARSVGTRRSHGPGWISLSASSPASVIVDEGRPWPRRGPRCRCRAACRATARSDRPGAPSPAAGTRRSRPRRCRRRRCGGRPPPAQPDQRVRVVHEGDVADEGDRGASRPAPRRAVDTTPSMPLAPRFA